MRPAQVAKRRITAEPSRLLDPISAKFGKADPPRIETNAETPAFAFTVLMPGIGIRAESMMNMEREQHNALSRRIGMRQMQQGRRIETAAIGDCEGVAGNDNARMDHSERAFERIRDGCGLQIRHDYSGEAISLNLP
jgi:hypothetical protein